MEAVCFVHLVSMPNVAAANMLETTTIGCLCVCKEDLTVYDFYKHKVKQNKTSHFLEAQDGGTLSIK